MPTYSGYGDGQFDWSKSCGDIAQATTLQAALMAAKDACWPIGSIFTADVSTNPATLLGFGTWSAFGAGRVLVGIDAGQTEFDTLDETGGSKTHTLTSAEMPAHTHTQDAHTHTQNAHSHVVTSVGSAATGGTTNLTGASDTSSTTATAANATATNQNTGGGGAHQNLPPYIVIYRWKRTA